MKTKMKTANALCGLISGRLFRAMLTPLLAIAALFAATTAVRADIYVSSDNREIMKVSSGGVVSLFATLPTGSFPHGLAFDGSGNLYVAHQGTNQISKITPGGAVSLFASVTNPYGLAFDRSGNLYVASPGTSQISKITPGGAVSFFASVHGPTGLAFDISGNLYAANYYTNQISKITPGGAVSLFATLPYFQGTYGLAFDTSGNLYAAGSSSNQISKITPGGAVSLFASVTNPVGLAFDNTGNLYATSAVPGNIRMVTSGGVVSTFATGIPSPRFIAFSSTLPVNNPPVADAGQNQSNDHGTLVTLDGSASYDDNTASAALAYAWSFSSVPAGSTATLANSNTATPSFTQDKVGDYVIQLIVTDDGVPPLSSTAAFVTLSSFNQAPTAIATATPVLPLLGNSVSLNGTASTDPEYDALFFQWTMMTRPAGSVAPILSATMAIASFTPDLPGTYTVALTVSDYLGAGTSVNVSVVAITAAAFVEAKTASASAIVAALPAGSVTNGGNQNALGSSLTNAMEQLQKGHVAQAISQLNQAIERTDGYALRGALDVNGPSRDWITDQATQLTVYGLLTAAVDALQ